MAQINKPNTYFNTKLYTGTGSTQSITGVGFQPDLVWTKQRNGTASHGWTDSVRGLDKYLSSEQNIAEYSLSNNGLSSFDSDGFTVVSHAMYNGSSNTYVSWNWLAGGTAVSNTAGSITSSVSASTTSGFSIVSYTGTGSALNFGHGLGVAPSVVIIKDRNGTAGSGWLVGHTGIGMTNYLKLNTTAASTNNTDVYSQNASSSLVYIGSSAAVNENTKNYICYCFAEKKGFSKFGSYTGNGSSDGAFIYTGFKPAMLIIKQTNAAGENWYIHDNKRSTYNVTNNLLFPNTSDAESTSNPNASYDFLSNGFKARDSYAGSNASGGTYIYMAFAENPLVGTNNIPATAR